MSCHKSQIPHVIVQDYLEEPIEGDNVLEFRLLYSGKILGASRNNPRPELKHEIRRAFHPQLRRLWLTHKELLRRLQHGAFETARKHLLIIPNSAKRTQAHRDYLDGPHNDRHTYISEGIKVLGAEWQRCGYEFIPLVSSKYSLRCSLDILFLRPEEPGFLIESGDLDNRVKTVFDALRMPSTLSETAGAGPTEDEKPFYCLLEDDKLISEVRVTTDQLLLLPHERELKPNDAFLVITVKTKLAEFTLQ